MLRLDRNNTGAVGNQIAFRHSASGTLTETGSINCVSTANAATGELRFYTKPSGGSNTESLRIESDGFLKVKADTGLNFANQTITSTSNYNRATTGEKFDYYEEGYIDPTAISAGLTLDTSSNRKLRYVRIGHWVSVSGLLLVSSRTSNNNTIQVAMPFTSASQTSEGYYTRGVGAVMYQYVTLSANMDDIVAYVGGNESYMRFFQTRNDGGGWTELVNSNLANSNSCQIYFSINYMVA